MELLKKYIKNIIQEGLSTIGTDWFINQLFFDNSTWTFDYALNETDSMKKHLKLGLADGYGWPKIKVWFTQPIKIANDIWDQTEDPEKKKWLENNIKNKENLSQMIKDFYIIIPHRKHARKLGHTYKSEISIDTKEPFSLKGPPSIYNTFIVSDNLNVRSIIDKLIANGNNNNDDPKQKQIIKDYINQISKTNTTFIHEFQHWIQARSYEPTQKQRIEIPSNNTKIERWILDNFFKDINSSLEEIKTPQTAKIKKDGTSIFNIMKNLQYTSPTIHISSQYIEDLFQKTKNDYNSNLITQSDAEKILSMCQNFSGQGKSFFNFRKKFLNKGVKDFAVGGILKKLLKISIPISFYSINTTVGNKEPASIFQYLIGLNAERIQSQLNNPKSKNIDYYITSNKLKFRGNEDIQRMNTKPENFKDEWENYGTELDAEITTHTNGILKNLVDFTPSEINVYTPNKKITMIKQILNSNHYDFYDLLKKEVYNLNSPRFSKTNLEDNKKLYKKINRICDYVIEKSEELLEKEFSSILNVENMKEWLIQTNNETPLEPDNFYWLKSYFKKLIDSIFIDKI